MFCDVHFIKRNKAIRHLIRKGLKQKTLNVRVGVPFHVDYNLFDNFVRTIPYTS